MVFDKASVENIEELTSLRVAYLEEDGGVMGEEILQSIQKNLPEQSVQKAGVQGCGIEVPFDEMGCGG